MKCFRSWRAFAIIALSTFTFMGGMLSTHSASAQTASATGAKDYDDDHSPELGVLVASCPGKGVCVTSTIWGSPASEAKIQAGDYILSVNEQAVSSPRQLKDIVQKLNAGDEVRLVIWRLGEEMEKQVTLASEAKTLPDSHRAWLGVMLAEQDGGGVVIEQVQRSSPAERAGLAAGDAVVKMDDAKVESIDQLVEKVRDLAPGTSLKITVRRGDAEQQMTVKVGTVDNAPMQWFRRSMRGAMPRPILREMPMLRETTEMEFDMPSFAPTQSSDVIDELIDEMRQQIISLQKDVEELKQKSNSEAKQRDDVSLNGLSDYNDLIQLVAQPQGNTDGTWRDFGRNRRNDVYSNRGSANLPHASNDWTGERYRQYRYNNQQQPSYNQGNHYHFHNTYPYYPYQYYQYQGRPYYYGGGYPYGYRGGVQIGPNFGVYW